LLVIGLSNKDISRRFGDLCGDRKNPFA